MTLSRHLDTLNLLGDESRIRLCILLRERELCVTDLVQVTGIPQPRVSTHLGRLREAGVVRDRKKGLQSFYALATDRLSATAKVLLDEAAQSGDPTLDGDQERLRELQSEQRGALPEGLVDQLERDYSPGRSWRSLALGLAALLDLGDVLDAGSGDGAAAMTIAPYCKSLTCIDTSERLIAQCKQRLAQNPRVRALVADVHALPFADASFDTVLIFHTLTYTAEPATALKECARVLRPGGRLILLCLDAHKQLEITAHYGERHPGFSPRTVQKMLTRAGLDVASCAVACRETKKPHLHVILASANKPGRNGARRTTQARSQ